MNPTIDHKSAERRARMSPNLSRRQAIAGAVALGLAGPALARTSGPFQPDWTSLAAGYQAPDWFRDAKLGIWAHWGPQCVPEFGDWYGRLMYVQGDPFYAHHVATYDHPSRFGFMEFVGRWKAENWEPEELIGLYKAAGAKYFVSLANHHDNLDCFDSAHHAWNTLRVGPKRDIVGTWAKAARKAGLRFGVSNHSAHAWHWWQTAYGYDAEGPLRGVRYDAFRLRKADGKGTWWEGLDPQELYTGPRLVIPEGVDSIQAMNAWHDAHDGQWTEEPPANDPVYARQWLARAVDLVEKYQPDFVYMDDTALPLGQAGLDFAAHYYNAALEWNRGRQEVVLTGKKLDDLQRRAITEDVERGFSDRLRPLPWQTDTCIGDWHYNRSRFLNHSYRSAENVIQRLCDTVSKNGNLLLSIPVRGDGTIDADERAILHDMAGWMAVGGEGIFASRPWKIYGEGPTTLVAGSQNEQDAKPFTSGDIRFTTKGGDLYAFAPARPQDGRLAIRSLGSASPLAPGRIEAVELLGGGPAKFERTAEALTVTLPSGGAAFVPALRIRGEGLV